MPGVSGAPWSSGFLQRELNLAFGARQREPLGLLREHQQRDDRHLHRLALLLVLLEPRAGGHDLDVREDHLGRHVGVGVGRARGGEHVDARAGQDVAGDADHFVDAHRQRAHAVGNHRRQADAGFLRRQLRRQHDLVLDHRADHAAADDVGGLGERPFGRLALREVHDRQVVGLELRAELQIAAGDDDRPASSHRRGRARLVVVDDVVRPVREPAAGEHRESENGKDSVTHVIPSISSQLSEQGDKGPDGDRRPVRETIGARR